MNLTQTNLVQSTQPLFGGFILTGDRVAIKVDEGETKTAGGIIVVATAEKLAHEGTIVALGTEVWMHEETGYRKANCPFYIGQKIRYGKYAGSEMRGDDGVDYLIMRENDLLAFKP